MSRKNRTTKDNVGIVYLFTNELYERENIYKFGITINPFQRKRVQNNSAPPIYALYDIIVMFSKSYKEIEKRLESVFKDKDYDRMLEILSDFSQTIVTYAPEGSRGLNAEILSEHAEKYFDHVIMEESQKEAWKLASNEASADGLVLACGSLSTVAALKDLILSENAREESYESN